MTRIIETLGHNAPLVTTAVTTSRGPKAGDPIRWPSGEYGRVDQVGIGKPSGARLGDEWPAEGHVHVCDQLGSAHLHHTGTVSISGGPFRVIPITHLEWVGGVIHPTPFWIWSELGQGAGRGADLWLPRPLFTYTGPLDL